MKTSPAWQWCRAGDILSNYFYLLPFMNRLTDNDKNWGPFTLARWRNQMCIKFRGRDDDEGDGCSVLVVLFGWALRCQLSRLLKPERVYGVSLSNMGSGYDFFQVFYGLQTWDSKTSKNWCKHLPWMMWDHVRRSIYSPDGSHFATEEKGKWNEFYELKKTCPVSRFGFEDYDEEMIVATCLIEEYEWHRGEGWFKWLRWFYPAKIRRTLEIQFSAEVGREKGSYKGGTLGHGIEMLAGETPRQAFERYCAQEHSSRNGKFKLRFVGPASAPATQPGGTA